jgi:DNA-binding IclR family transcriptional regulator
MPIKVAANDVEFSQTVLKALLVLECVADADRPLSAAEVAKLCKISRPTAYRLLSTLAVRDYVTQVNGPYFRLGTQALSLSKKLLDSIDLPDLARPYLRELGDATNETVYLSTLQDAEILYIAKVESTQSIRTSCFIGTRNNLYSTSMGKAVLAFLPAAEQARLIEQIDLMPLTSKTIVNRDALVEELANIRKRRYAIDDEENEAGVRCVGAPIFDRTGRVIAAISVSAPAYRFSIHHVEEVSSLVLDITSTISARLGYAPQDRERIEL